MKINKPFWELVRPSEKCCIWIGKINELGYGRFIYNKKRIYAHRLSWEVHNGLIPKGLCVLHKCDNPPCINPKHLFLGTRKDNMLDMVQKGRHWAVNKHVSFLSDSQVIEIRRIHKTGKWNQRDIARKFKISQYCVYCIIHRLTWKHIKE